MAVSRDGTALLVADCWGASNALHELSVADGSLRRVIGRKGDGPLQFMHLCQVYIAADGLLFVAHSVNHRIQVLTPTLDFHGIIGHGQLSHPSGVCANADVVVVSETGAHRVTVLNRHDGAVVVRFGEEPEGTCDGQLKQPTALCLTSSGRHVAVAGSWNNRVSVFSVHGAFITHVGRGHREGTARHRRLCL